MATGDVVTNPKQWRCAV